MITDFNRHDDCDWDQETGHPGIALFGNAVQVWSFLQGRKTTLSEAALVFNVEPELIRRAVAAHAWMLVDAGEAIGHEGE